MILRKSFYKTSVDTATNFHVYNYRYGDAPPDTDGHEKRRGDRIISFY